MNSQHTELCVYELYLYIINLSRDQETIEFDHSIRIDDLFEHLATVKRQIRGLGFCMSDLSKLVLEPSAQSERLNGEIIVDCGVL